MSQTEKIIVDSNILVGKPIIAGTRMSVEFVIGLLADGCSIADILTDYPGLTHGDVTACLAYARDHLAAEKIYPSAA